MCEWAAVQIVCVGTAKSGHPLAPDKYFICVIVVSINGGSAAFSTDLKCFVSKKKKRRRKETLTSGCFLKQT